MLEIVDGDLFADPAPFLVNPVNCVGVMGAGLAREFARRFPGLLAFYEDACNAGAVRPGGVLRFDLPDSRAILNCATKNHWRRPSQVRWVSLGFANLLRCVPEDAAIACPALGCGLGGLRWADVESTARTMTEIYPGPTLRLYRPR